MPTPPAGDPAALAAHISRGVACGLALSLGIVSCGPAFFPPRLSVTSSASFERAASKFPEIAEVSDAIDRIVRPLDGDVRERQLDLFAEVFTLAREEHVDPPSAKRMVVMALQGVLDEAEETLGLGEFADAAEEEGAEDAQPRAAALDAAELIDAGLSRMMVGLDPHSNYLSPDEYRESQVRSSGRFGGIGIEVTMDDGLVRIVAPMDGTPGARAGLASGDLIVGVDDTPVEGLTLSEAVRLMRGPVGEEVRLEIRRPPEIETFEVTVERAVVRVRPVRARAEGRVGYLRIAAFNERTEEGLRRGIRDLSREIDDEVGYVMDLRGNPGGLLDQALGVADTFLTDGEIVSTRGRAVSRRFPAGPGDLADGLPVVVLIDGGSASAAEIVSGALQDHDRALIVGERSFGKGSVQTVVPVSGGGAVRVTTSLYYTPSGRSIQSRGIAPDILAAGDGDAALREADLGNALPAGEEAPEEENATRLLADVCPGQTGAEDPVLACAIHLLEGRGLMAGSLDPV